MIVLTKCFRVQLLFYSIGVQQHSFRHHPCGDKGLTVATLYCKSLNLREIRFIYNYYKSISEHLPVTTFKATVANVSMATRLDTTVLQLLIKYSQQNLLIYYSQICSEGFPNVKYFNIQQFNVFDLEKIMPDHDFAFRILSRRI